MKIQQQNAMDPWLVASQVGALFFAVVALALGTVSLTQYRRGNWRGVLGVIVSGLFVLCVCGGAVLVQLLGAGVSTGA